MSTIKERITDNWINQAFKSLDLVVVQGKACLEEDESLPSESTIEAAKEFLSKCASHLNLDQPEIRLSPNGDIYFTWVVDGWQHVMCFAYNGKPSYYTDYEADDYLPEKVVFTGFVESQAA